MAYAVCLFIFFVAAFFFSSLTLRFGQPSSVGEILGGVAVGFIGPIFFVYIGCQLDLSLVVTIAGFLFGLLLITFFGKLIGDGLPAYWAGLSKCHALAVVRLSRPRHRRAYRCQHRVEGRRFQRREWRPFDPRQSFFYARVHGVATTLPVPALLRWILRPSSDVHSEH